MVKMARNDLKKNKNVLGVVVLAVCVVFTGIAVGVVLNRDFWNDWYRGINYRPTAEMAAIRENLDLTGRGEFLFNAAQPELNEASEFNTNCRKDKSEIAVLGCYRDGYIYIYNIVDDRLNGIRELTAAHELLHAVWTRMSNDEKKDLGTTLLQVYEDNTETLEEDIATYEEKDRLEEIFVRAGTEVKSLPDNLEKMYAEIFENQDKIVDFYNNYIAVFRAMKLEMAELTSEMEILMDEINIKTEEYEKQFDQLEADIISFNSCAEIAGCFENNSVFYTRRSQILSRQDELSALNEEINVLIDEYNEKVDLYNADVTESYKLQDMINSNKKVESI